MSTTNLNNIIDRLETISSLADGVSDADALAVLRQQIDELDVAILQLLNRRSECANRIGEFKKRLGVPVYVPTRESQVLQNVQNSNPGPLENDAIRRLFERIIDETRSLERRLFQSEQEDQKEE
jgi:chorismate mutase-like protein